MPFAKVYLHIVWSVKCRKPLISKELKPILLKHIKENSITKGIFIDNINCVEDHIHLLISLGTNQTIAKTVMLLKGESSFWVNKQKITRYKFEWQEEYFVQSISKSAINIVRKYINNQEEHHKKKSFSLEYEEFLESEGFDKNNFG